MLECHVKKVQFVKDLKIKDQIKDIFLVKYIAAMDARDGRKYLNLILADSSGSIETRKWRDAEKIVEEVVSGDYIYCEGKINLYQGRTQFVVDKVKKIDEVAEGVDLDQFIKKSSTGAEKMYDELLSIVEDLDDVYLKDLLKLILVEPEIKRRLELWGAGKSIHHAYQAGLLEHILSCTQLAVTLSAHYKVNKNYVVAGAILHDICKIYELTSGPVVEYTEEGKLIGHLVKSLEIVDRYAHKISKFPRDTKMHLKHILVAHHGQYEYGSPKLPQTSEAYLLHLIDLMDSKMNSIQMIKENDKLSGRWSGFVRHMDRLIYKDELPAYDDYITDEAISEPKQSESKDRTEPIQTHKQKQNTELKFSMADKLKDLKLD